MAESSHPRLGTESSETRLAHHVKNEVHPCRLKSGKPYNKEAQEMLSVIPEDRSKDAWIAATWKQEWEASGPTRVHRHISDPGEGVKGKVCAENTGQP